MYSYRRQPTCHRSRRQHGHVTQAPHTAAHQPTGASENGGTLYPQRCAKRAAHAASGPISPRSGKRSLRSIVLPIQTKCNQATIGRRLPQGAVRAPRVRAVRPMNGKPRRNTDSGESKGVPSHSSAGQAERPRCRTSSSARRNANIAQGPDEQHYATTKGRGSHASPSNSKRRSASAAASAKPPAEPRSAATHWSASSRGR